MARGHKTGGRQKGTPNKRKAECDAKFAGAAGQATTGLSPSEIASMMPLDVCCSQCGLRSNADSYAPQFRSPRRRPYVHPKMAPRAEEGGDKELTIKIIGGLPE